jgi:tellurite resistance protein TerC
MALDLGLFHRKAHAVGIREALIWSLVWVTLSLGFGSLIYSEFGAQRGLEFFTGYLIEYSLSIDNVFVFVLIFPTLQFIKLHLGCFLAPHHAQSCSGRCRSVNHFWMIYVFGAFLVFTGWKILRQGDEGCART